MTGKKAVSAPPISKKSTKKPPTDQDEFERAFTELAGKDNPPIDDTYLSMIESGDVQLTDELFFRLLRESPDYINKEPFQTKNSKWTLEGNTKMLNRIKTMLRPERRGRKHSSDDEFETKEIYLNNIKLLSDFKKKYPDNSARKLNEHFKEEYPELNVDFRKHRSAKELAFDLTADQLKKSDKTIRNIIKRPYHRNISKTLQIEITKK